MTGTRRALVLLGLILAATIGGGAPASATFTDSQLLGTTTVATGTVAPPVRVEVKNVTCTTTVDPVTGAVTSSTVNAMVEWGRSLNTPGITGYRVTAHLSNGSSYVMAQTNATTYEAYGSSSQANLAYSPRFTVTTLTSYGWTATSARSAVLTR
jgi:hypothetical protein